MLTLLFLACSGPPGAAVQPPPHPVPVPEIDVAAPWATVHARPAMVAVRYGDEGDGVRVSLGEPGRVPGVTLVHAGRTLEVADGGLRWPLASVAYPDRPLTRVQVVTDGPDLVVRFEGPPLREVFDHPAAPSDPALTWIRIRPRASAGWRIVVDGLTTISLPYARVEPTADDTLAIETPSWGRFELVPGGRLTRSEIRGDRWSWSTLPSLARIDPYPRTRITFTPVSP